MDGVWELGGVAMTFGGDEVSVTIAVDNVAWSVPSHAITGVEEEVVTTGVDNVARSVPSDAITGVEEDVVTTGVDSVAWSVLSDTTVGTMGSGLSDTATSSLSTSTAGSASSGVACAHTDMARNRMDHRQRRISTQGSWCACQIQMKTSLGRICNSDPAARHRQTLHFGRTMAFVVSERASIDHERLVAMPGCRYS